MAILPQIDNSIENKVEKNEVKLPSKTYKLNNDTVSTGIELGEPTVIQTSGTVEINNNIGYDKLSLDSIRGNTYQATRSGKNYFNPFTTYSVGYTFTTNGITFTLLEDGRIKANGTASADAIFDISVNQQIINGNNKKMVLNASSGTLSGYAHFTIFTANWITAKNISISQINNPLTSNLPDANFLGFRTYIRNGGVCNNLILELQILDTSEEDLSYEQYGAMPSVDYPSEVKSVGDNGSINFNITNKNQLIPHSISSDAITNNNNTFTFKADLAVNWYGYIGKVYLKAGETYTIWSSARLGYGRIGFSTSSTIVTNDTIPDITIISSASTYLLVLGGGVILTKFTSNIDQVVYLYYCSDVPRTDTSTFTVSIQIEEGNKTTYIDHKGEEISLPTQKPFRKIGDYADKFIKQNNKKYEKHNIYKYILNGTEDWTYNASSQEFAFNDSSVIAQLYIDLNTPPPVLSSHYKITAWLSRNKNLDACVLCYGWTYTAFRIKDDRFTNVNDFKAYLTEQYNAGKPVYFVLILATSELIECTAEQDEILNHMKNLSIQDSSVIIRNVDEIGPYDFKVTYYSNDDVEFKTIETDRIEGYIDGIDAVKQAIYHILNTERYAYLIYDENYGIELQQYIGADLDYIETTIENTLKEALTHDLRITNVSVTDMYKINNDILLVKFIASTIYGDLVLEVNVNV